MAPTNALARKPGGNMRQKPCWDSSSAAALTSSSERSARLASRDRRSGDASNRVMSPLCCRWICCSCSCCCCACCSSSAIRMYANGFEEGCHCFAGEPEERTERNCGTERDAVDASGERSRHARGDCARGVILGDCVRGVIRGDCEGGACFAIDEVAPAFVAQDALPLVGAAAGGLAATVPRCGSRTTSGCAAPLLLGATGGARCSLLSSVAALRDGLSAMCCDGFVAPACRPKSKEG